MTLCIRCHKRQAADGPWCRKCTKFLTPEEKRAWTSALARARTDADEWAAVLARTPESDRSQE